jgi:hypothetical protein
MYSLRFNYSLILISAFFILLLGSVTLKSHGNEILQDNPNSPSNPVRLVFIHHSTGGNWLANDYGGLGKALKNNNYYVSDVCYGWGPNSIGDRTDIGNWWEWFREPDNSPNYLNDIYKVDQMDGSYGEYDRLLCNPDPAGENVIIMFKSCFPNSALAGNPNDPIPAIADNPMKGESAGSDSYTVANAKGIYIDLLEYFKTKLDKLFIVITAPPLSDPTYASNARVLNQWLVNDWLRNYPHNNVFVFDFYNCLTTNGGSPDVNDLGMESGNHHRWWNGTVQHTYDGIHNTEQYPSGDDHPNTVGNAKTTTEYLPLLNVAYNRWANATKVEEQDNSMSSPVFTISPNTVAEKLRINYNLPNLSGLEIRIINSLGIVVDKMSINAFSQSGNFEYNVSKLSTGGYFVVIKTGLQTDVIPVIVYR